MTANWSDLLGTPEAYATPGQRDATQAWANALLKRSVDHPIYANSFAKAWPQMLGKLGEAAVGGLDTYRGGQRERKAMELASKAYPNDPTDPALMGRRAEGGPPPAPMAAGSPTGPPSMPPAGPRLAGPMPTPDSGPSFADRAGPVGQAIASGDFDPQGMNNTDFKPAGPKMAGGPLPYGPTSAGAPPAMARALAGTPAGGGKPALGVTGPGPGADAPIPPGLMPSHPTMDRKQFEAAMSNPWIPKEHKDAIMGMYYGQGQPIQTQDAAGNPIFANPRNPSQQRRVWGVQGQPLEVGKVKTQEKSVTDIDPATGMPVQRMIERQEAPGESAPISAPRPAPAPAPPPETAVTPPNMGDKIPGIPFAPKEGGPPSLSDWLAHPEGPMRGPPGQSAIPFTGPTTPAPPPTTDGEGGPAGTKVAQVSPRIQRLQDWNDDQEFKQHQRQKEFDTQEDIAKHKTQKEFDVDQDALEKRYTKIADNGLAATTLRPQLELARNLIDNDRFYSGIGSDIMLAGKQLKAALGNDPQAAAAMEMFRKVTSGAILGEMRSTLQGLGQVRIAEIDLLGKAMGNLSNTRTANKGVLDLTLRANTIVSHLSEMASAYKQGWRWDDKGVAKKTNERPTDAGLADNMQRWANKMSMKPEEIKKFEADLLPPPKAEKGKRAPGTPIGPSLPPGVPLDK